MKEGLFNRTPRMSKAEDMAFTPAQGISATEIQTAIEEAVKKITVSIKEENTSALTKGQVICCTGASGEKVKVGLCDCDDPNKLRIMGLVFADIGQNAAGISVYKGELTGIDSQPANTDINPNGETWAEGALLWVADTPGGMTHTRPTHGRSIKAAISRKGSCADDILQVISHENPINVMAAAGEDVILGMGDSAGTNKISFKDYSNTEVGKIDSDGVATFNTLVTPDKTPVNAVASVGKITSDATAPSDADTVTIDTKVYTFKTTLTPTEGEVLIGASAAAALDNLKSAINHTGTPDTDYKCAAVHPTVEATTNSDTTQLVAAKTKGVAGDLIALAEVSTHLIVDAATLGAEVAGVDGTVGVADEIVQDTTYIYVCLATNTIADNNWRRISVGAVY